MELMLYFATSNNPRSDEGHARGLVGILACRGAMAKDALKSDVVPRYQIFDLALNFDPVAPGAGWYYYHNADMDPRKCTDASNCYPF